MTKQKKKIYVLVNHPDIETTIIVVASKNKRKLIKFAKENGYPLNLTKEYFDYSKIEVIKEI